MVQSLPEKPLVALQGVLQEMREQSNARVLVDLALNYIRQVFVAPLIWLALYDYNTHTLIGQGGVTLLEDYSLLTTTYPLDPGGILEQVVIEQRPISLPDLSQEPRMGSWQQEAKSLGGIQGCMIYPVQYQRRCMGLLMLGSQVWGVTTTDEEKALLSILLGQLSASLSELEVEWHRQQEKRVDEPLLVLSQAMREVTSTAERVSAVVSVLQDFMAVSRVQIYWLNRQTNELMPQSSLIDGPELTPPSSGTKGKTAKPAAAIYTRDLGDTFYSLQRGQLAIATEAKGSAQTDVPPKMMQLLRVQAVMLMPILLEGDFLGMVAAESDTPRTWSEPEKQLIGGAANLMALAEPLEKIQITEGRIENHLNFIGLVAQKAFTGNDVEGAMQESVQELCERLQATACSVLVYRPVSQTFSGFYEYRREGRMVLPRQFGSLNDQDWTDLTTKHIIAAENYAQDLRLLSWKAEIEAAGIPALMLSHTGLLDDSMDGAILVVSQNRRAWSREDRQLLESVSEQVGVMLRQSRTQEALHQQEQLLNGLINTATVLQSLQSVTDVYSVTTEMVAQLFQAPMTALVTWIPGEQLGYVQSPFYTSNDFKLIASAEVEIYRDPLIAECLHSESGIVEFRGEELSPITRTWLNSDTVGWGLATPLGLQDGFSAPIGILVIADQPGTLWDPEEQTIFALLGHTCGWTLRRLLWTQAVQQQAEVLRELNWYKHRRLFEFQNTLLENLRRLGQVREMPGDEGSRWQKIVEIARGLRDLTVPVQPLLKSEAWAVSPEIKPVPVASLIRRTLRRIDPIVQKRKLWPRVHGDTGFGIQGDMGRLEMVLYEVLIAAALRSREDGRIDLWVQDGGDGYAEILIVDEGLFDEALLEALQGDPEQAMYEDPLSTSVLSTSPGLELCLCQRVIIRMGGELNFYPSQDERNVTRLVMPYATDAFDELLE